MTPEGRGSSIRALLQARLCCQPGAARAAQLRACTPHLVPKSLQAALRPAPAPHGRPEKRSHRTYPRSFPFALAAQSFAQKYRRSALPSLRRHRSVHPNVTERTQTEQPAPEPSPQEPTYRGTQAGLQQREPPGRAGPLPVAAHRGPGRMPQRRAGRGSVRPAQLRAAPRPAGQRLPPSAPGGDGGRRGEARSRGAAGRLPGRLKKAR